MKLKRSSNSAPLTLATRKGSRSGLITSGSAPGISALRTGGKMREKIDSESPHWIQKLKAGTLTGDELGDVAVAGVVIVGWVVICVLAIGGWL